MKDEMMQISYYNDQLSCVLMNNKQDMCKSGKYKLYNNKHTFATSVSTFVCTNDKIHQKESTNKQKAVAHG